MKPETLVEEQPPVRNRPQLWLPVRIVTGAVLILAAIAKGVDAISTDSFQSIIMSLLHAHVELLLGIWLWWGMWPVWSRIMSIVGFALFLGIAFRMHLSGAPSCGCFGSFSPAPGKILALDSLILIGLAGSAPSVSHHRPSTKKILFGLFLTVAFPLMFLTRWNSTREHMRVLNPDDWMGQHVTVLDELSPPVPSTGKHVVVFVHSECEHCLDVVNSLQRQGSNLFPGWENAATHIVDIGPPHARQWDPQVRVLAPLPPERWIVRTPVALFVEDGVLRTVNRNFEGDHL